MASYKNLDAYLWVHQSVQWMKLPAGLLDDLLQEIRDEPPLAFDVRYMFDINNNEEVFATLWFGGKELWDLAEYTKLLPREILGLNSPKIIFTYDPCMLKLAWHIGEKLDAKQRKKAKETIKQCAKIRQAISAALSHSDITSPGIQNYYQHILKPAIHHRICLALSLPVD